MSSRLARTSVAAHGILLLAPVRTQARHRIVLSRALFHRSCSRRQQEVFHSQLQDPSSASLFSSLKTRTAPRIPQTLTEKIIQKHAVGLPEGKLVQSGDYVTLAPHHCMTHDNSWPVATKFMSIGASKIHDPKQIVMTLDHDVQNKSEKNLKKYRMIEEFAKSQNVDFYPAGRGIGHQIMVEEGYAWPGTLCVASDSHSNMYGGVSCLGTAVVRTDAASIWATGKTWWQIPPIARVNLLGTLPSGVSGKDVIIALCGLFSNDEVLNHAIEFTGSEETMSSLSVDNRLAIANMTTEWGALSGCFPADRTLQAWMRGRASSAAILQSDAGSGNQFTHNGINDRFTHDAIDDLFSNQLQADEGAKYAKTLFLNLSTLFQSVSGPNSVKIATPLAKLAEQNIKINKAYLVSCTNSRASDFASAAKVFKDIAEKNNGQIPKIADGVKFYIAGASIPEVELAKANGDWQTLIDAGAQPLPAGCGPCIGLGTGLLEPGEVGISASNRNFKGRMGSTEAKAYLASPEVVAASALNGIISSNSFDHAAEWSAVEFGLGDGIKEENRMLTTEQAMDKVIGQLDSMLALAEQEFGEETKAVPEIAGVDILPGFPEMISGEIVFLDAENISTDGIFPGALTYTDDVSKEDMAQACMKNYDPEFKHIARAGDIIVTGRNFGCGSSREQAATAILAKGIPLVVAQSLGNVFSRNSINNALIALEVPQVVEKLREAFGSGLKKAQSSDSIIEPSLNKESLDTPKPAELRSATENNLTRRTGWTLTWNVAKANITVVDESGKSVLTTKVGSIPPNVQEIIARGGLENWVKSQLAT